MIDKYCREEFEKALKTIEKQAYELSVLRNGLERLRHDNNWQGVDDVNGFIDKLLAVK